MDSEGVNQAEIARRLGVTRARVTQLLKLLTLSPEVRARVREHAAEGVLVSERSLRSLIRGP